MSISEKTRKTIWARSGNRCAFCRTQLVLEKDPYDDIHPNIGEECHLISKQSNGPRHITDDNLEYDGPDNLILLCRNHHKMIDEQKDKYSVQDIKIIKEEHENWVKTALDPTGYKEDTLQQETAAPKSKLESLVELITNTHKNNMTEKSNQRILESPEGLTKAFEEGNYIKKIVNDFVADVLKNAEDFPIKIIPNTHRICNIEIRGYTIAFQLYQAYANSAKHTYLLIGTFNGTFDENGRADPILPAKIMEVMRLDFAVGPNNDFGWRNQEGKKEFYLSLTIIENWLEKFVKFASNPVNKSRTFFDM